LKKKIVGIFVIMLLISSAMTTIIVYKKGLVEASEEPQINRMNLDYNWVWNRTIEFGEVIYNVEEWPNDIKKGREWGTAGERYTIDNILKDVMDGVDNPCGLSEYKELRIGYLEPDPNSEPKQYTSKIVITDYGLTIHKEGEDPEEVSTDELFPLGIGCLSWDRPTEAYLDDTFEFINTEIIEKDITKLDYNLEYSTVPCNLLNEYNTLIGPVVYLDTMDPIPENHDCVFILNEESASEEKIDNLSDAIGCILIEDSSKEYTFENSSCYNLSIVKVNGTDSNFSSVIEEIQNGSLYLADNIQDNETIVFNNCSNQPCCSGSDYVVVFQLNDKDDFGSIPFFFNIIKWSMCLRCQGAIMSNYAAVCENGDTTHAMSHTVRGWAWFAKTKILVPGPYSNRFPLPILSVSHNLGQYLIDHAESITVDGHITQEFWKQTPNDPYDPEVISYNVVAYRNITSSPNDPIVVLSNRMDSWWGECPGDASTSGAILLGIAKYMEDNDITPKYDLTFLFTTGEEYGMRGAQHYIDSHPKDEYNYKYWIGFEQLGFHYPPDAEHMLSLSTYNSSLIPILNETQNQTNYEDRIHNRYNYKSVLKEGYKAAEDYVWKDSCDTILIEKSENLDESGNWDGHHQVGNNYQEGDSLQYIDRDDVNVTFELAWNVTKYFTVNPDCCFSDIISFTAFDSPNDGDTLNDSIRANFTINSVLPDDKVRVELDLGYKIGEEITFIPNADHQDYVLHSKSQEESFVFTIPDDVVDREYAVSFKLYNSTGRIDKIVYGPSCSHYNDSTEASDWFHLYHPLGYVKIGDKSKCVNDNISGSVFTANEDGRADNITAYINQDYMSPGPYKCMLYQASTMNLIGTTTSDWVTLPQGTQLNSSYWAVFNFTGTKPLLEKDTQYVITCWGDSPYSEVYYCDSESSSTGRYDDNQPYGIPPPDPADFTNEPRYYSIYCSYTPDVSSPQITDVNASPHTVGFGYNVTITANVTDSGSGVNLVKVNISTPGSGQSNNTMTYISGNQYCYVFTDTWCVGQYNYSIWAQDNETNSYTSETYHFHVSADATISIATLKDTYSGEEYINITDPPNPSENLTLVSRGLTWDNYYNTVTGDNLLEVSTGPINYQEDNESWTPINTTINQLATNHPAYVYGYRTGNNHGLYGAYFKANIQNEWPVVYTYSRSDDPTVYAVRSKLLGVGYVDPASNFLPISPEYPEQPGANHRELYHL
jgi:hypothetical protein